MMGRQTVIRGGLVLDAKGGGAAGLRILRGAEVYRPSIGAKA